jgi:L-aminopeptidase/D-esterase-like protein
MHWVAESGLLCYPIVLTNTHQVGTAHAALVAYGHREVSRLFRPWRWRETWDGWLNDMDAFPITAEHVIEALEMPGRVGS